MTTMCPSFSKPAALFVAPLAAVGADPCFAPGWPSSREHANSGATASSAILQLLPNRENMLANPGPARGLEEMRSIEIERENDVAPDRGQRLRQSDARGDVVPPSPRVDEGLIAQGLDEI